MDCPEFIVCSFMENSFGLKRVKSFSGSLNSKIMTHSFQGFKYPENMIQKNWKGQ